MLIYRIEDKDGNGPYEGKHHGLGQVIHNLDIRLSAPNNDVDSVDGKTDTCLSKWWKQKRVDRRDFICAFQSLKLMYLWFPKEKLYKLAVHSSLDMLFISVYEIDEDSIIPGDQQCMFHPSDAKLLGRYDGNELEKLENVMLAT